MASSSRPFLKQQLLDFFRKQREKPIDGDVDKQVEDAAIQLSNIIDNYVEQVVSRITGDAPVSTTITVAAGIDVENLDITPIPIGQTSETGSGSGSGTAEIRGHLKVN